MSTATDKNYLDMSDEDFLQIPAPELPASGSEDDKPENKTSEEDKTAEGENQDSDTKAEGENNAAEGDEGTKEAPDKSEESTKEDGDEDEDVGEKAEDDDGKDGEGDPSGSKEDGKVADAGEADTTKDDKNPKDPKDGDKKSDAEAEKTEEQAPDYKAFFDQVMKPFKANGREIQLKTPEEAIRLMQMGAGYGKKLQNLQPALKTLKMLENNSLLDETQLSFLIDINNGNVDAIKKLIKEKGIDPLDLNIEDNVSYTPKSHSVSDEQMAFHSVIDEVKDTPTGLETLRTINQTWDATSKAALASQPKILSVIHEQRENGIYSQIVAEIDRQKLLGQIAPTTPFLEAYKLAGDHLTATNGFKQVQAQIQEPAGGTQQPQVIEKRTAAPKSPVQNSDKAAAAAPTKTGGPKKPAKIVNPLSLPDDEFMKQAEGLNL